VISFLFQNSFVAWMKRSVIRERPIGRKGKTHYSESIPPIGGMPRIPAFGLHPGYTCCMEVVIYGTP
jgi:hypothetical protein